MNVIQRLTFRQMKKNKKRTLITILGVAISVAMITAVATTTFSFMDLMRRDTIDNTGYWHVSIADVPLKGIETIQKDKKMGIQTTMLKKNIGYALNKKSTSRVKPYFFVAGFDKNAMENMSLKLLEGRMPQNDTEILLPESANKEGGIQKKPGDSITLELGYRYIFSAGEKRLLWQKDPVNQLRGEKQSEEQLEKKMTKTYKVTGIIENVAGDNYSTPGYTFVTYLDQNTMSESERADLFLKLKKHEKDIDKIGLRFNNYIEQTLDQEDLVILNSELLRYEGAISQGGLFRALYNVAAIAVIIIIVGSVFLIYNSFAISMAERSKYLGIISSVGATKRQKRSSVFFEGMVIGLIGIPLGIIAGIAGMWITFQCINPMIKNALEIAVGLRVIVSGTSIIISIVCSVVTIFISCYIPARKASKVMPIEAIRQNNDIVIKKKNIKTSKITRKLFGFEGVLALKNIKRNRKRYFATLLSLIVSLILFLSIGSLSFFMRNAYKVTNKKLNFDGMIRLHYREESKTGEKLAEEIKEKAEKLPGIKRASLKYSLEHNFYLTEEESSKIISDELENELKKKDIGNVQFEVTLSGLSEPDYSKYLEEAGIDRKKTEKKGKISAVVINHANLLSSKKIQEYSITKLKENDTLSMHMGQEQLSNLSVAAVTDKLPIGMQYSADQVPWIQIIMSENQLREFYQLNQKQIVKAMQEEKPYLYPIIHLVSAERKQFDADMRQLQKEYSSLYIYNVLDENQRVQEMLLVVDIFAYGFIILMTAVCTANIFNMVSTGILLRKQEFAMIRSVGMTPKIFHKMIIYESMFYALKTLIIGLPLGGILIALIYRVMKGGFNLAFHMPWIVIGTGIGVVIFIIGISMLYSSAKIRNENIVDNLREENI